MASINKKNNVMEAQREAYGKMICQLGESMKNIVVLDADVSKSTRTVYFSETFPKRFFNFGIAEQNMMTAAAGFSKCGLIPFVNSFSFLTTFRAGEQFRSSIAYPKLNVKVVAHYGGLSDSFDGPTHQSIADIAWVRAMPNITVIVPADSVEVKKALPVIAKHDGPVWLRLSRNPSSNIYSDDYEFQIGKATVIEEGTDVTIVSCGTVLSRVLEAAEALLEQGINAQIISVSSIKPFDKETIIKAAKKTGAIVTCEEHNVVGGLGSAVCETVAESIPVPVIRTGIPDCFAESGDYMSLLDKYGLSIDDIVSAVKLTINKKQN